MKLHIIGICGTFMGGLARLAIEMGYRVSGSDANTYPPMSTQLQALNVDLREGYNTSNIPDDVDLVLVGNTISRGNPELESVLSKNIAYTSGAQWLGDVVLKDKWVMAVAGTHGKTTTSSMLAWLLEDNGLKPGYLIGGVPANFEFSARLGESPFFVVEADEYDTAFSDKRSKFVHYRPRTLVLNNLEFDHADIFEDLDAIKTQFHHLLKIIPEDGLIIHNAQEHSLHDVIKRGCWSQTQSFGRSDSEWLCNKVSADASQFKVSKDSDEHRIDWPIIGDHNMMNATAAIAAAHHVGVPIANAVESLGSFQSVKRRLETLYDSDRVSVIDDFAHHPTAITTTVEGLRSKVGQDKILAVLEPRSNTMKQGVHQNTLKASLAQADHTLLYAGDGVKWDIRSLEDKQLNCYHDIDALLASTLDYLNDNQNSKVHVLIMSNGGFEGLHQKLLDKLTA